MRSHSRKQAEEATIDLTPMLDVVFIMLIFFIVTATFVKESGIDVFKPAVDETILQLADKASVLVAINADNEIYIQQQAYDVDAVGPVIERLLAENPKGWIVIQPDKESDVTVYAKVQDAIARVGAERVVMATDKG
ncbi:MAG: ExbD/TolR family protein [Sphingomonadales bacterium]